MKVFRAIYAMLLACAVAVSAHAEDRGTKEEAKSMLAAALEHAKKAGAEQSFKDFQGNRAQWVNKDLYVFVVSMQGNVVVHGGNEKLVGKNMMEIKDPTGKAFVKEMIDVAKAKNSGAVEYEWVNPVTKKMESKVTFLQKLPNYDGLVGVGAYR